MVLSECASASSLVLASAPGILPSAQIAFTNTLVLRSETKCKPNYKRALQIVGVFRLKGFFKYPRSQLSSIN